MENAQDRSAAKSLKDVFPDSEVLPQVLAIGRATAYELYQSEKFKDLEVVLKGLLAADARDAWALSLYGSMLRKQNRFQEAAVLLETALALEPTNTNIRKLRDELAAFAKSVKQAHIAVS